MSFTNPPAEEICALLRRARTIAVVGFSPRTHRPSYGVAASLQRLGYRIIPVRPGISEGLGEKAYPRLGMLPEPPDIVDVFRASEHVSGIIDECLALGYKSLWLQDGVIDEAAAARAVAGGMMVVMDRCLWRDARGLCAGKL
jgi:uncharacterized protein